MGLEMNGGIEVGIDTMSIDGNPTALFENLAKAHAEFLPIPKQAAGQIGKRNFKYADYATIMRCVRPALSKYGISIIQLLHSRGANAVTTTILAGHGASVSGSFSFKPNDDPQEFGRHHTYYRRYQLQAILCIEGDKDADDLPDVNESRHETSGYTEPAKESKAAPKAPEASVEKKPVPANGQKTNGSAKQSDGSTSEAATSKPKNEAPATSPKADKKSEPSAESAKKDDPASALNTINKLLANAMEQLGWEMPEILEFYKGHVDPAGFKRAANLTIDQKRQLHAKLVEVHNVAPF